MKIINENIIKKVLKEQLDDIVEINTDDVIDQLYNIKCTGGDLKKEVIEILRDNGYYGIRVVYLGKDKNNRLMYIAKTNGPIFTYKAHSKMENNRPCLHVFGVNVYEKR